MFTPVLTKLAPDSIFLIGARAVLMECGGGRMRVARHGVTLEARHPERLLKALERYAMWAKRKP